MARSLAEVREEYAAKAKQLHDIFNGRDVADIPEDEAKTIKGRNDELTTLSIEMERLRDLEAAQKAAEPPKGGGIPHPTPKAVDAEEPKQKTWKDHIFDDEGKSRLAALKNAPRGAKLAFDVAEADIGELKNTIALTDLNNPATRLPRFVISAQEERTVADLMAQGTTDNNSLTFIEETTFTNSAATVAEGGAKPESALDFTERTVPVRKIATWVQATDEILEDVSGFESYVRGRLGFMIKRVEESQLLTGTGAGSQITGILNAAGIQTQAKGADPTPDAVYKAMTLVRNTGFAEPDAAVFHPNDWQDIKLLRTADGIYIWGSPMDSGPDRIWGLPVRITTAETQNTGLVGAFQQYAQIFRRTGIRVEVATEHASNFISNIVTILAEERLALAIYRGAAFATITGI